MLEDNLARLLCEFAIVTERERDLRRLYFLCLPIILMAFSFERGVVFKYSTRKDCFDPKAGLVREDIEKLKEKFLSFSVCGEFAEYLGSVDVEEIYNSAFNRKIRALNIPCNDITRSILNPLVVKEMVYIKREEIKNHRVRAVLQSMGLSDMLYVPLLSESETVGFMLLSPDTKERELLMVFASMFGLSMANLIKRKEINSLKVFIEENDAEVLSNQRLYAIGKTASTIAHEIKNSLVGIMGLFAKLKEFTDSSEKAQRYVRIIETELEKLYSFALGINRYSRSSSFLQKEIVNLSELVDKVIEMVGIIDDSIVFSVCIDKEAEFIYADRVQIEQVLMNLLKNSVEAYGGKKQGKIRIVARREGDYVVIRIRDNAGGVPEEQIEKLTKPFFTTKPHGTGLGLAIVSEIIKDHGGTIDFKNVPGGLECIIRLPIPRNLTEVMNEQEEDYDS